MSLEGNDPVIGHGGRVSLGRNQGGQPVTNGQKDLWGKGRARGRTATVPAHQAEPVILKSPPWADDEESLFSRSFAERFFPSLTWASPAR